MRCARVRSELTAFAENGLQPTTASKVRAHVERCSACATELRRTQRAIELQSDALRAALPELGFAFETRLAARLGEAEAERPRLLQQLSLLWKPAVIAAVGLLAVLLAAGPLGKPGEVLLPLVEESPERIADVLVPLGIQEAPDGLVETPELYVDYPIIEHLEELEHFETVDTLPYEEEMLGESKGTA